MNLKSEQIQAEIDNKNAAIEAEALNGQQTNHEAIIQWRNEINILQMQQSDERALESQHHEAKQAQAEQIGGLKETVRSIFEASFPKDETVKLMGLTEYESTQQTFNQLIDQAVDEDQTALYAAFQQQLEQRDEKFRLLTLHALELQRQFDETGLLIQTQAYEITNRDGEIEKLTESNLSLVEDVRAFETTLNDFEEKLLQSDNEIQRLKDRELDLQKQIANVQTVPHVIDITPTMASESLSERIAQAKVNSKLQLANVTHIAANWVEGINSEGNKEVAHVNDVEQVNTFPTIEPVIQPELTQEATTEEQTFQEVHSADSQGDPSLEGYTFNNSLVEQTEQGSQVITLEALKAELEELKSAHEITVNRVATIERHANIQAVA